MDHMFLDLQVIGQHSHQAKSWSLMRKRLDRPYTNQGEKAPGLAGKMQVSQLTWTNVCVNINILQNFFQIGKLSW